jgi:O-antigen ligase
MTFAGLLLLAWPPAAAAAVACRGRARLIYALLLPVFGLALLLGFTRGAWIGSVVAGLVLLARARPRWAWVVPVVAALALVVMPPAYRSRALSTFDPHHPTNVDRLRLWHTGWNILRHHPWTGVGPVDLRPYVLRYRSTTEGQVHGHLHDNWIHIAATLGSIGLLAFLWLMIGLGRMAWGAGRARAPAELHGLALGIWGSYCGFQWMGLFEWNFGDVEVTIALYFLLGAGWAVVRAAGQDRDIDAGPTGRGMSS